VRQGRLNGGGLLESIGGLHQPGSGLHQARAEDSAFLPISFALVRAVTKKYCGKKYSRVASMKYWGKKCGRVASMEVVYSRALAARISLVPDFTKHKQKLQHFLRISFALVRAVAGKYCGEKYGRVASMEMVYSRALEARISLVPDFNRHEHKLRRFLRISFALVRCRRREVLRRKVQQGCLNRGGLLESIGGPHQPGPGLQQAQAEHFLRISFALVRAVTKKYCGKKYSSRLDGGGLLESRDVSRTLLRERRLWSRFPDWQEVAEKEEDQVSVLKEDGNGSQLEMKRIEPSNAMSASGQGVVKGKEERTFMNNWRIWKSVCEEKLVVEKCRRTQTMGGKSKGNKNWIVRRPGAIRSEEDSVYDICSIIFAATTGYHHQKKSQNLAIMGYN
jgi:hypothetical protein